MKTICVSELKANLSSYLKRAHKGERILVLDRKDPVAEIGPAGVGPAGVGPANPLERLATEGKVRLGTQQWGLWRVAKLGRKVAIQDLLRAVREDAE